MSAAMSVTISVAMSVMASIAMSKEFRGDKAADQNLVDTPDYLLYPIGGVNWVDQEVKHNESQDLSNYSIYR